MRKYEVKWVMEGNEIETLQTYAEDVAFAIDNIVLLAMNGGSIQDIIWVKDVEGNEWLDFTGDFKQLMTIRDDIKGDLKMMINNMEDDIKWQ